ncbi:MAG: hypothetical protein IJ507_10765 [Clostridia bacterium]|nr:hypothetical protein [Clostridia bacterium]
MSMILEDIGNWFMRLWHRLPHLPAVIWNGICDGFWWCLNGLGSLLMFFLEFIVYCVFYPLWSGFVNLVTSGELSELLGSLFELAGWIGLLWLVTAIFSPIYWALRQRPGSDRGLPANLVRGFLSAALAVWAVSLAGSHSISLADALQSVFPTGDFQRISQEFQQDTHRVVLNKLISILTRESTVTLAYILPAVALDVLYMILSLFCRESSSSNRFLTSFFDIVSTLSVFVIMSCYETPQVLLLFKTAVGFTGTGTVWLVLFGILLGLLFAYAVMDILSNNILLSMYGFLLARQYMPVTLEPWQDIAYIVLCFVCGYAVGIIRGRLEDEEGIWDDPSSGGAFFGWLLMSGGATLIVTGLIGCGLLQIAVHWL